MSNKSILRTLGVLFSISVTAVLVVAVLLSPQAAMALTATIVNNKEAASQLPNYKLGEMVTFTSEISLPNESHKIDSVRLLITGPQPLDVNLPVIDTGGAFTDLTTFLPTDGAGGHLGKLTAKIQLDDVTYGFFGYGYGYGYTGGPSGKIKYTLKYLPPVLKHPAPAPLPGPMNNPSLAFPVPGGAAGGGSATETGSFLFPIPGVPGVAAGAEPRGLFWDGPSGQLLVLMDGTPDDVILFVDPFAGFLFSFTPLTGISDATGVTVVMGDVYVLREGPSGKQLVRVIDKAPTGDTVTPIVVPDTVPGGDVVASGGTLFAVDNQPVAGAGIKFREFDPFSGAAGGTFTVPDGPSGGGFTALTTGGTLGGFLGGFEATIVHFDGTGFVMAATEIDNVPNIQGLASDPGFAGPGARLLVADGDTSAIYEVVVGAGGGGPGGGAAIPRAITGGASPFYILVDDSPVDRVLKVDQAGALLDDFDTTSDNVESLVLFGGKLFYVDNAVHPKKLHRIAVDGTMEADNDLPDYVGDIGDLSSDGANLYAVERWSDTVHKIAPQTTGATAGTVTGSFSVTDANFADPFFPPGGLEAAVYVPPTSPAFLIGGKFGTTWRMDPVTFGIMGGDNIIPGPPWDLTGMTLVGSIVYMVDASTQAVYKAARPDAPPVDLTAAGSYQAVLQVYVGGALEITSPVSNFVLEKVSALTVNITSPSDGQGFGLPGITVSGSVSDPTATVLVGVALPEAVLFGNDTKTGASTLTGAADRAQYTESPSGSLWQFIDFAASGAIPAGVPADVTTVLTQIGAQRGQAAWYGKFDVPPSIGGGPILPNYDTGFGPGGHNFGDLDTLAMLVGASGVLTFDTWYDTEPGFYPDKKLIQFCSGAVCNTIAQITPDVPL
ncbi:MAG: hypothetical protein Q8P22_03880, partial [Chloroflexota bacterium]|nr:hypothetical protein [Chloroflexota bacterium]